ncbi:MAG: sugar ABC transporter ATP-binding protein [Candidatus Nanopelagicales bacterium]|jgi:ribose transport system ATP-binding protein|nr:sugar ABC transporter ATP-binding protein [Candidatus Nanopelagicales bacterium]
MNQPASVVISDLTKSYGGNTVLDHASVTFSPGRVHALLGPNGAGKSTLLGCLSGAVQPDSGTITCSGRAYRGFTPSEAFGAGISTIYQHFQAIDDLTVADNIYLGAELRRGGVMINSRAQLAGASALFERLGVDIDPRATVGSLSVGQRQLVEIAKALRHEPATLILDEPTSALSQTESVLLLELVTRLAHDLDIAVIYVTHLLHEVLTVADEVTVLRDGKIVWTRPGGDLDMQTLVTTISPDVDDSELISQSRDASNAAVLELDEFSSGFTGPLTVTIKEGDIVGVFGLLGSGRSDLLETISGVHPRRAGHALLHGRPYNPASVRSAINAGVALIPSDRSTMSIFGPMTALENVLLPRWPQTTRFLLRSKDNESKAFERIALSVQLKPPFPWQSAERFSGGNAQKLVVGRWLNDLAPVSVLVLDEPTQGIDVGSRRELYRLLRSFVKDEPGRAVIFASSDPEEIERLANRVLVLSDGVLIGEVEPGLGEDALLGLVHSREGASIKRTIGEEQYE